MAKVLVVEDDADVADVTAYALQRHGFEIAVASDGVEALARWRAEAPDLVVLDVHLPRLSGFDVARAIRAEAPDASILFLSAYADAEHLRAGHALGAAAYVTKPYSYHTLIRRIEALLDT